jgi:hypothetical protein
VGGFGWSERISVAQAVRPGGIQDDGPAGTASTVVMSCENRMIPDVRARSLPPNTTRSHLTTEHTKRTPQPWVTDNSGKRMPS